MRGTIGSGAITSTGKITGTELEGTSLDINGAANFKDDGIIIDSLGGPYGRIHGTSSIFIGGGSTSQVQLSSALIPDGDSTRSLGSGSRYWSHAYVDAITTTGKIQCGGELEGTSLDINGNADISGETTFKPKHYAATDDLNSDTRTIFSTHTVNNATSNRPINYSSVYTLGGSTSNALQISTNEDYSESGMWIRQYNQNSASPQGTGWQNWAEVHTTNSFTVANVLNSNVTLSSLGAQASGTYNTVIGTDSDITTSGATVIDDIYMTDGVVTSHTTRTLTASDIGAQAAGSYAAASHNHDDRYYTETETDAFAVKLTGDQTIAGNKTFSDSVTANQLNLKDGGDFITFYGGDETNHSISSRDAAGCS